MPDTDETVLARYFNVDARLFRVHHRSTGAAATIAAGRARAGAEAMTPDLWVHLEPGDIALLDREAIDSLAAELGASAEWAILGRRRLRLTARPIERSRYWLWLRCATAYSARPVLRINALKATKTSPLSAGQHFVRLCESLSYQMRVA